MVLIEHKGMKARAIRFQYGGFITTCGSFIPAVECLIYGQGIWWDFKQVEVQTGENFRQVCMAMPTDKMPVETCIARVLVPEPENLGLANLNNVTPS